MVLARHPDANGFVRFGRLFLREEVDIYVHVLLREPVDGSIGGADLSGLCLRAADRLKAVDVARALEASVAAKRSGDDPELRRTRRDTAWMPGWLLRLGLRLAEFLQYGLNLRTDWLGVPRDPVGSAEVSSVGMFGIRTAYGPFFPLARNAIAVVAGAVEDDVLALDGEPVVTPVLTLNATFDHRVIDGFHAAVLTREVRQLLEHPTLLELDPADTRIPDARAALSVGRAAQRLDSGAESVTDENEKRAREGAQSRSQEG
jgi:pyruvate dehydrogenase E2 component (dihydrolipoamide acetyltransferase)